MMHVHRGSPDTCGPCGSGGGGGARSSLSCWKFVGINVLQTLSAMNRFRLEYVKGYDHIFQLLQFTGDPL